MDVGWLKRLDSRLRRALSVRPMASAARGGGGGCRRERRPDGGRSSALLSAPLAAPSARTVAIESPLLSHRAGRRRGLGVEEAAWSVQKDANIQKCTVYCKIRNHHQVDSNSVMLKPPHGPLPRMHPLRAFDAAARHASFIRAAQELGVYQPTISRYIAEQEHDIGVRLFARSRRAVNLTPAGEVFHHASPSVWSASPRARSPSLTSQRTRGWSRPARGWAIWHAPSSGFAWRNHRSRMRPGAGMRPLAPEGTIAARPAIDPPMTTIHGPPSTLRRRRAPGSSSRSVRGTGGWCLRDPRPAGTRGRDRAARADPPRTAPG